MNILINLSNRLGGGSLQVALSFISECSKVGSNNYYIVINENIEKLIDVDEMNKKTNVFVSVVKYSNYLFLAKKMDLIEAKINPDAVFSVFGPVYWTPKALHIMGYATPYCIYPESPFFKKISFNNRIIIEMKKKLHKILCKKEANVIICETEDATSRLKKYLRTNDISFYTVSNTCSDYYKNFKKLCNYKLPEKKNKEFRFLFFTKYYSHKNIELLPKIEKELFRQGIDYISFVLTLPEDKYNEIIPVEFRKNIYNVGYVKPDEGPSLYAECDAVIQPSFLEVFSANYPEAMCMKKPLLVSDYGFARSVCKDAAIYFNPLDINDVIGKIKLLVQNDEMRTLLIKKEETIIATIPSAENRMRKYLDIIEKEFENQKK